MFKQSFLCSVDEPIEVPVCNKSTCILNPPERVTHFKKLTCPGSMSNHGPPGKKKSKEASEKKRRVKIEGESQGDDNDASPGDMAR